MNVFLDDERDWYEFVEGWITVRSYEECISVLQKETIDILSLDHDLGTEKTGYDVLLWIEEQVKLNSFIPPREIRVHTANPVGRDRMLNALKSIYSE